MELIETPIEQLIPYARNARTHSDEQVAQIAASIKEFGFTNPVLIDGDGGIIAGHGRVLAARKLDLLSVPVIKLDYLTENQKRAYIIADNKLALNAGWDMDLLKLEIEKLQESDFDNKLLGFTDYELNSILLEKEEGETDAYKEWDGMPEFKDNDLCHRKVWVSFDNEDDVKEFFSLIGQGCTDKTKSIWFPEKERGNQKDYEWVDNQE